MRRRTFKPRKGNTMSASKYNLWKPEYILEIEEIDAQHKKFFAYCGQLLQLADVGLKKEHANSDLVHLCFNLRSYAFTHFMDEERMMLNSKYPQAREHLREHDKYLVEFLSLIGKSNLYGLNIQGRFDERSAKIATLVSEFAARWLEEHIYSPDKALAEHLKTAARRSVLP